MKLSITEDQVLARFNEAHERWWKNMCNAESLLRSANNPCDGVHECDEDHGGDECDCNLRCECEGPEADRAQAAVHAQLAQASALMANTAALLLPHASES